ncbi:hypothetical protein MPER_12142 [Moniliophthora perniciosa FA553]|nr:hypothetical protein MPER_12142 [Moniliophthora perniciosa FA553]
MPDDVPIVSVSLANVAIESFLYGIFFVLNIGTIMLIYFPPNDMTRHGALVKESLSRRIQMAVKKPMFWGSIALFISITAHWICTVLRLFEAVVFSEKGPLAYYKDLSQALYAIKTGFSEASLIIADMCGSRGNKNDFAHYVPGQSVFSSVSSHYCLIGYRIWWIERESRYSGAVRVGSGNSLSSALAIFVESALLYTTWTTVFIATYAAESRVESVISDCWAVVAGISVCLINVRIGLGWVMKRSVMVSTVLGRQQACEANTGETWLAYPMQPLAIHVHQVENTSQMDGISFSGVGGGPDSGMQKNESRGDA